MMFLLIVTITSMLLAAIMSVIAWRVAAEERRRSDARVAALAADIHAPAAVAPPRAVAGHASGARRTELARPAEPQPRIASFPMQRSARRWDEDLQIRPVAEDRSPAPDLFAQRRSSGGSRLFAVALVVAFVATAAAAVVTMVRRAPATPGVPDRGTRAAAPYTAPAAAAAPAPGAAAVPLELVALGHDRVGDRLTVRGTVRNPPTGAAVEELAAVVSVFGADGGLLTSGRAIIESPALGPGGQSTFAVTVRGAGAVARYRVSFRNGDRIVPHVDRREPQRAAS